MTFPDYTSLVWEDYNHKKADPSFPIGLVRPTCANLKEACEKACSDRYQKKDERALKDFFGTGSDQGSFLRVIRNTHPDKFRPLYKYMRGEIRKPDDRNIELLAWLIDFEERPWYLGTELQEKKPEGPVVQPVDVPAGRPGKKEKPVMRVAILDTPIVNEAGKGRAASKFRFGRRYALVAIFLLTFLSYGMYWVWRSKPSKIALTGHEACMYWAGDHYEPVSCSQPLGDTLVVALDSARLLHFRKIMRPDTITQRSKGFVWYIRVNGAYEYYTSKGNHPLDPRLRLSPLTDFIIRNHLHVDQGAE